ncbi:hypothetical protein [Bifidobacterium polysaccharolyticum]|uniref:hypothetical protein n=1 Tax=Bifidobacterium polysaccharolyticum TaxID=2750967 RepID=UPI0021BA5E43|nr:hypothetical protein [Bifidobacterium polysaccharolyticum]MCT8158210.1 hypothetical protein [Bifidobacterium polysaccharolyticum]
MTRASQQAKALQDIRQDASDEELKRRYGYSQAVIQAMRETVSRESCRQAGTLNIDEEGPEF